MLDKIFPEKISNCLELIRFFQPNGFMLLLWPCWFGLAYSDQDSLNLIGFYLLFFFGSFIMRSAGCIINDLIDIQIDHQVLRTMKRPLTSKKISVLNATIFLVVLLLLGLLILIQFSNLTIFAGLLIMPLVIMYPFMKRITYWPQLFLGLVFNWGIIICSIELLNIISFEYLLLYIACIFWTLSYDTIYAYQDRIDDIKNNIKSSAVLLGENGKKFVKITYSIMICIIGYLSWESSKNLISIYVLFVLFIGIHYFINKWEINSETSSNKYFRQNNFFGSIIFLYLLIF